jgi:hypothetical protein
MAAVTHEFILAALTQVDTGHGGSLVAKGWVGDVIARDGHVLVTLDVPQNLGSTLEPVRAAAEKAVHKLSGVVSATIVMTAGDAGSSAGVSPLDRKSSETCSVPEGEAKLATEPTPIDEFIAAIELVAQNHPDGLANLAALGYRQNFPGKLMQLSKTLTPVLTELISRAEKAEAQLAKATSSSS